MRRALLSTIAVGLGVAGALAAAFYIYQRPTLLRVAVARGGEDSKVIAAAQQAFVHDGKNIRFRVIGVNDFAGAAEALETGEADLAVVRSDIAMPAIAQTLVILHRNAAVLLAPAGSSLTRISGLRGQRIGVLRGRVNAPGNIGVLDTVLAHYDVPGDSVTKIQIIADELPKALQNHEIDAVLAVGVPAAGALGDAVATMTQIGDGPPVFIPIAEASAIAQRLPAYEAMEIVAGTFGGTPQRPVKSFQTLSVTVRLVARSSLGDSVAADIVRHLFNERGLMALTAPLANRMEQPTTEKGQALPTHPGAAAFLDDDEQTFMEKNGDFLYLGAMLVSVIGSGLAAFASRMGLRNHSPVEQHLGRLLDLMKRARETRDMDDLDAIQAEADLILVTALGRDQIHSLEGHRVSAFGLAFDQVRIAIKDRRIALAVMGRVVPFEPKGLIGF